MRPFEFCVLGLSELALFGAQTLRRPHVCVRASLSVSVMKKNLKWLIAAAFISIPVVAEAEPVPSINNEAINAYCEKRAGTDPECVKDEQMSYDNVRTLWRAVPASERQACLDRKPDSYVDLASCLASAWSVAQQNE